MSSFISHPFVSRRSASRFSAAARASCALLCLALPALLHTSAQAQYSFSAVTLDPGLVSVFGFNDNLQAYGTDGSGNVVITGANFTGLTTLGTFDPAINQNSPFAVNNAGQVAGDGTFSSNNVTHAFLSGPGGLMDLGAFSNSLDPTFDLNSHATGINSSGQVVGLGDALYDAGGGTILTVNHALLYQNGTLTDLGGIPNSGDPSGVSANSEAQAINDAGVIVGDGDTEVSPGVFEDHAFVFSNGAYSTLGTLNNTTFSYAAGINNSNQIIGYSTYAPGLFDVHAFLHTGTGLLTAGDDLGTFGGADSFADYINDSGRVLGVAQDASGAFLPFVYQGSGLLSLNDFVPASSGLSNLLFYGLNNNNQILGSGTDALGNTDYFLLSAATVTPEPGAFALAGALGLLVPGLLARKRRQRKAIVTAE